MPESITVYTLEELETAHPEAYARVLKKWEEQCDRSSDIPWSDEIMDSLKAAVELFGCTLKDWSIGPHAQSWMIVDDPYEADEESDAKLRFTENIQAAYAKKHRESPKYYLEPTYPLDANGEPTFPGYCLMTGVCFDDDFLEHVWREVKGGESIREALQSLARVASKNMEESCKDAKSAEAMQANWGESRFTADGVRVD